MSGHLADATVMTCHRRSCRGLVDRFIESLIERFASYFR